MAWNKCRRGSIDPIELPNLHINELCVDEIPAVKFGEHLNEQEINVMKQLLFDFRDVFGPIDSEPAKFPPFIFKLKEESQPICVPQRHLTQERYKCAEAQVRKMVDLKIYVPSKSNYALPLSFCIQKIWRDKNVPELYKIE